MFHSFSPATAYAAAIGFYDGVHRGHQFLLHELQREAAARQLGALAVTFAAHPRETLTPTAYTPLLLTTQAERIDLLQATGISACAVLDFTPALAALTAEEFLRTVLHDQLGVRLLLMGYDHRFGSDRLPNFAAYVAAGRRAGVEIVRAKALQDEAVSISSSAVRRYLMAGNVDAARLALGRPYALSGRVGHGKEKGRQIGFPTANLVPSSDEKIIPGRGVYVAKAEVGGRFFGAMVNIGHRPTLQDGGGVTIEAHLFAYSGAALYDQPLTLHFLSRLRDERRFESLEALRQQLERDAEEARFRLQESFAV